MKVLSTYKILKEKAFNSDIDESWSAWAMEMIQAGLEANSLYELAGISKPYNQFELQELTNQVLRDLKLDFTDNTTVIRDYAYFIISSSIDVPEKYFEVLKELKDICIGLDMEQEYMNFYLLYFAKDDLLETENQWYWNGADRTNIDKIIQEQFHTYKMKLDTQTNSQQLSPNN